jgi:hypothetical protein
MSMQLYLYPVRQVMNNAVQTGAHVNVAKELTTADDGAFASDRSKFLATSNTSQSAAVASKKWVNSCTNRDASSTAERRRVRALGTSLNTGGGAMCNMSKLEQHTRTDAIRRARAGGANVPQKVRSRPGTSGAPAPHFGAPHLVRTKNRLPWLEHPEETIV